MGQSKTTSIGKLAPGKRKKEKVLIAAVDTFRAGTVSVECLRQKKWC